MKTARLVRPNPGRWDRLQQLTGGAANACFQCGTCSATCPVLARGDAPTTVRQVLREAQLGSDLQTQDFWFCTACRQCETRCPRDVPIVEAIMGLRAVSFEEGKMPPEFHTLLWGTLEEGNPWAGPRHERAKWANGLGIKDASKGASVLLYAGCAVSYDARLQGIARGLAAILGAAGVDFGILGAGEKCCGDAVRSTGERDYLARLVEQNVKQFQQTGAQTILTVSPHCYDIFRNVYPAYGLTAEVLHATQYLERLLDAGKLKPPARAAETVAYHDPCFLGRHNGVFEAPRKLLENVPGVRLVEMPESRWNALCCGGGGGGMWQTQPGERLSDRRYDQAVSTGAGTLASTCPYCIQNFEDSGRRRPGPKVVDIIELLAPKHNGVKS